MRNNTFKGENEISTKMAQKNIIDPLLKGQQGLKQDTWQRLKEIFGV